jgi:hypothetical protein
MNDPVTQGRADFAAKCAGLTAYFEDRPDMYTLGRDADGDRTVKLAVVELE